MRKTQANDSIRGGMAELGYAEVDPSGRYGRFKEILGKGAMKTVYKAFDEVLGIEVAWNQVKLNCVLRSPDELQRLYSEVHLLKNLNHSSIMRFYTSWINVDKCTFNFITEMFTAGTLREYRQKYKRVHIRAVKDWARQILEGLTYLHSHDPPVIHRDLKCDNIFINGHLGQVKIGDLGLAATLCESQHAHSVIGTPEFMAPEMYEEDYNELVDIYSFGMCVLEMLTSQYPYSECSNPAQIYKKVTTGKLPKAYHEIQCPDAKRFIGKCLENASTRPSARELLMEPFLVEDHDQIIITPSQKLITPTPSSLSHDPKRTTDMKITGTMNPDDGSIFLKVFISDKIGKARNIYFPFDVESDTAHDVATEMVKELEIEDWKPLEIAEMIDKEIVNLIPSWKKSPIDLVLQNLDYHSFCYDDDDDDNDDDDHTPHPFRSTSLHSSPHASPRKGCIHLDGLEDRSDGIMIYPTLDLIQGNCYDDDGSSESSLNSCNYSSFTYSSGNEDHEDHSSSFLISQEDPQQHLQKTNNFTRFCGEDHKYLTQQKAIKRVKSVVDIRSQSLHRTLVEEIHKRRLFNTVAAIENIGYHEPAW